MQRKRYVRLTVQLGLAAGLTYLFLKQDYVWAAAQPFFTWSGWFDPLQGGVSLFQNYWPWLALVSLASLAAAVCFGRVFCGWICPVGTILDLAGYMKKGLRWPNFQTGPRMKQSLRWVRWALCGGIAGLLVAGGSVALIFNPLAVWPRDIFRITHGMIPWSMGALILLGLVFFPRFWCRFLCPAGGVFNWLNRLGNQYALNGECKQCRRCLRNCPMQNIEGTQTGTGKQAASLHFGFDCLHCGLCIASCPTACIQKRKMTKEEFSEGRRDFVIAAGFALAAGGSSLVPKLTAVQTALRPPRRLARLMRPPGALAEGEFNVTCNRCGQCLQVCPTKVLVPAGLEAGLQGLWTPKFLPYRGEFRGRCMFCMACGQVCPTQALAPVSLETVRLGTAAIDRAKCLAWANGIQCLLCVETCPKFAIQVDASKRHPVIDLQKCNGCGSCEAHCPVAGSAVFLTNSGEIRRI